MFAYLHGKTLRDNGTPDTFWTVKVPMSDKPMPHHIQGLSYTATGYGNRIPTRNMVFFNGSWRRVYCRIFSNIGTCYIGTWATVGEQITVREAE